MALTFLGIESSCDDTAAAVVRSSHGAGEILSSEVMGQTTLHAAFGGVVPEIAARAHAERLDIVTRVALEKAGMTNPGQGTPRHIFFYKNSKNSLDRRNPSGFSISDVARATTP